MDTNKATIPQVGQYWRVRVTKKRTMLGKVLKVRASTVTLERVNNEGEPLGADTLNLIMASIDGDLVRQMEMDNYYGMIVEIGTAKRHICNHNLGKE